jgi:two-component system response regulator AtoC
MHDLNKKLLVIDDEANMRHMLSALLAGHGYSVQAAENGSEALELLETGEYDYVLCDIRMPVMDGMAFLQVVKNAGHTVPVIMMSAFGTVDLALKAMKQGAYDYISKPFKNDEIVLVLKKAEERERLRRENIFLRKRIAGLEGVSSGFDAMIGKSKAMQELFVLAGKVARHPTTVLITGESGTGKELVAKGIHGKSPRAQQPFVAVNCGGIPENLLESEFFGYVRGAFTGADRDKKGLFEEARGGTLFLDEIGELPKPMQVKMLRVLQEQEIRPIGGSRNIKVDVRILAATARDLADDVQKGRFREDLYYRLNVMNVHLSPLRERIGDIPLLGNYFVKKFAGGMDGCEVEAISPAAMELLMRHSWPGNVRELENVIERAVILADKHVLLPENFPETLGGRKQNRRLDDLLGTFSIKEGKKILEQRLIARALEATGGNKSRAAEILEISYPSLLSKIKEYGI